MLLWPQQRFFLMPLHLAEGTCQHLLHGSMQKGMVCKAERTKGRIRCSTACFCCLLQEEGKGLCRVRQQLQNSGCKPTAQSHLPPHTPRNLSCRVPAAAAEAPRSHRAKICLWSSHRTGWLGAGAAATAVTATKVVLLCRTGLCKSTGALRPRF